MFFEEEDVEFCLQKVREIRDLYDLYVPGGVGYPKSVDWLTWLVAEYLQKRVTIEYVDLPAEGSSIQAAFWAMADGSYRIGVLQGMSEELLRFVLCKELFHVIFDDATRRSIELGAHVEEYTSTFHVDGRPNCAAAWETLAEMAATEFLFPFERRSEAMSAGLEAGSVNFARLAAQYGLPRLFVETFCQSGNMEVVRRLGGHDAEGMAP